MKRRLACLAFALLALGPASAQEPQAGAALAGLKPQRPGVVDAFLIDAALDVDPVFNREARQAAQVLAARFDADGRTIVIADDEGSSRAGAPGNPDSLASALAHAAAAMDRREDVLVLYTTSHGSPRAGLNYDLASGQEAIITPAQLTALLAGHGFENRLLILQACFSGQFVPDQAAPRTDVATAASAMHSSFGCSADNDWTFFGHALINQAMRKADTFARQFRRAVVTIIGWEQELGIEPSNPQISIGKDAGPWLAALDARAGTVRSEPVGRPPSQLPQ